MTITNRLKILIAEKEIREKRKLTYRIINQETGISAGTLARYMTQQIDKIDMKTLETLCEYFNVQPGDFFVWDPEIEVDSFEHKARVMAEVIQNQISHVLDIETKNDLVREQFNLISGGLDPEELSDAQITNIWRKSFNVAMPDNTTELIKFSELVKRAFEIAVKEIEASKD